MNDDDDNDDRVMVDKYTENGTGNQSKSKVRQSLEVYEEFVKELFEFAVSDELS